MTVVSSKYARIENDLYQTEPWATEALIRHFPVTDMKIWEPAAGNHLIADVLKEAGATVHTSDFATYERPQDQWLDFLDDLPVTFGGDGIITNPPYGVQNRTAVKFAEKALERCSGLVALLLTAKFDSGSTQGLGQFGNGLSQVGTSLATGGAGGGSGWLSFLSGSIFSGSGQLARSGGIGLFANGTNYAPGGLSVVGERGPELVNLPQGSSVMSNHKLMQSLNDNNNQRSNAPANLNVNVIGANGDEHVRALVRQGVGQALSQYNEQQRRVGFGETQKRFVAQKG